MADIDILPCILSDRLELLARLPQDWDSYGANPISPKAIARTAALLREILTIEADTIPFPFIAPRPDGGVMLEWKTASGRELILDIPVGQGPLTFLLVEPTDTGEEKEIEGDVREPYTLYELISWLSLG